MKIYLQAHIHSYALCINIDIHVYADVWLTLITVLSPNLTNPGHIHVYVSLTRWTHGDQPGHLWWLGRVLFHVHITVEYDNVVWFSTKPTTHTNLTRRSPTLWMEYLYPTLLQIDVTVIALHSNPSPNRTNPFRIVSFLCLLMLVLHALHVIFYVCVLACRR
jgi:hypothetical protein